MDEVLEEEHFDPRLQRQHLAILLTMSHRDLAGSSRHSARPDPEEEQC
jgi:hypothetical protein